MNIDGTALDRKHRYNRRRFLGIGAVAVAGAGTLAFVAGRGTAHDGTPEAGGTPEASPSASPAASPVASATEVTVHTVDLAFEPRDLTIPANTDVTVRVENLGVILHDLTIDQLGVTSGTLSRGQATAVTINAAPGTYQFYCSIPGHRQAGMRGTLTVE